MLANEIRHYANLAFAIGLFAIAFVVLGGLVIVDWLFGHWQ